MTDDYIHPCHRELTDEQKVDLAKKFAQLEKRIRWFERFNRR